MPACGTGGQTFTVIWVTTLPPAFRPYIAPYNTTSVIPAEGLLSNRSIGIELIIGPALGCVGSSN